MNHYKVMNEFLSINFTGQERVEWYIQGAEKKTPPTIIWQSYPSKNEGERKIFLDKWK